MKTVVRGWWLPRLLGLRGDLPDACEKRSTHLGGQLEMTAPARLGVAKFATLLVDLDTVVSSATEGCLDPFAFGISDGLNCATHSAPFDRL
jgi:hypothetical protein